jgi:hypothetical protein
VSSSSSLSWSRPAPDCGSVADPRRVRMRLDAGTDPIVPTRCTPSIGCPA